MILSESFFSQEYTFQWTSPFYNFEEDKKIYIKANTVAYQEQFSDNPKEQAEKTSLLSQEFKKEFLFFKTHQLTCHWVRIFDKTEKLLGFCLFEKKEMLCFYIREIAVDPAFWGKGIAVQLVFSILEKIPETKKLILVTRVINKRALSLYHKCGFKRISPKIHPALQRFSSQEFQGFQWIREESPH